MNNIIMAIIAIGLWSPGLYFGYHISHVDGRTTMGQASNFEWLIFWVLVSIPYFVLSKIKIKDKDED